METEKSVAEVEEGEITDDNDDDDLGYKLNERPSDYHSNDHRFQEAKAVPIPESESESNSDSDSSSCGQKVKVKPKIRAPMQKRKRYDIWSTHIQEDILTQNLINCDVSKIDRSRSSETYVNYTYTNKRKFDERKNVHLRLGKRPPNDGKQKGNRKGNKNRNHKKESEEDSDSDSSLLAPRDISELKVTADNTNEEVALDISNKLCEEKENLILKVVNILGKEKAIKLFNDTRKVESEGGMLIMNGTRRRTPGGIYLYLLKREDDITYDAMREIFQEERQKYHEKAKAVRKLQQAKLKSLLQGKNMITEQNNFPPLPNRADVIANFGKRLPPKSTKTIKDASEDIVEEMKLEPNDKSNVDSSLKKGQINTNEQLPEAANMTDVQEQQEKTNRHLNDYKDDFLDIHADNMDLF